MGDFTILSAPRYDSEKSRWFVDEKNNSGEIIKEWDFASRGEADGYIKQIIIGNKLPDTNPKKKKETKTDIAKTETNFLENSLKSLSLPGDNGLPTNDFQDSNWELEVEEFKERWKTNKEEFKNKAVNAIDAIAGLYFDAKLVKRQEAVAYKKEMEAADIATLLLQSDIAERAIFKLMQLIELGTSPSSRMFEVLAQMQKFVVDLVQAKKKFLFDVEEDFKRLRDDISILEATSQTDDGSNQIGDKTSVTTNNSKLLIQNITIFAKETMGEMAQYLKVPSKNSKLKKEGDDDVIEDALLIENDENDGDFIKVAKKGLERFEE